ncbi:MAG TPA: hypothetical protein VMB05_07015 [Solirubrobacteraceae bacterium]|nr:hypothetical protein [Solirubrobacteraceae bacterium]
MLSGLAVAAALTGLVAGVAGAWSPCGFSMVDTIGSALGDARRGATSAAGATFALGTLIGGAVTFGSLALLGSLVDGGAAGLREALGAALALGAAIADWRGLRIAPQIRRQVPERWRWTMPLPLACALYGVLLGLGFTTFVLAFAVWALAGVSFASGDPLLGMLVGVCFGAGRALPVLWMAPSWRGGGSGAHRLEQMALEPRLWLGLRRLDALGLGLCALALGGASASASEAPGPGGVPAPARASIAPIVRATDPSAAGSALTWQALGSSGALSLGAAAPLVLPGSHPAVGGTTIAWASPTQVTVATLPTLAQRLAIPVQQVNALAVSDSWVVYRATDAQGGERLTAVSLVEPARQSFLAGSRLAGRVGRPALDGSQVVFALNSPRRSAIELVDLTSGRRRTLRANSRDAALFNPSLLGGSLLFERVTRCVQQLRLATLARGARSRTSDSATAARRRRARGHGDRVLLSLPSKVFRDPGYQRGYTHAYNSASGCRNRAPGRGGSVNLGATALGPSAAYVTRLGPGGNAEIVSIPR